MNKKHKKLKLPKLSDKEIAELVQACQFAFGDQTADDFPDEVMTGARAKRKLRLKLEQQQPLNQ